MCCELIQNGRVQRVEIVSAELAQRWPKSSGKLVVIRVLSAATGLASDEIALQQLNQDLEGRVEQRTQELIASLDEKEVLLKELHHRVKNNLQMIQSLLNLQARSLEDPRILEVLTESQKRIRAMALVHEKLYQSDSLARIRFAEYVRSLTRDLLQSYVGNLSTIQVSIQVADVELPVDTAIPCGLIINELFSNAIKYAFPGNRFSLPEAAPTSAITVQFRSEPTTNPAESAPEHYVLIVSDNGIGIPASVYIQTTRSLGLRLVHALTRQLRGTLNLDRHHGTQFTITFAKPI
jgi:two-component sensor histidine kinase